MIDAAQLLPLDDRKCGIERVEISDLNVARILAVIVWLTERDPSAKMFPSLLRTRCHSHDPTQRVIGEVDPHPNVDKRDSERFELFNYSLARRPIVDADEHKIHAP